MRGTKCSHKKAYVKVEGEDSDTDSSSERKSDQLSYSYSCVKSFRKNQHIIGDLAALHSQQEYQGIAHQPALYSLSGPRNKLVCQPFYCSTVSEDSDSSEAESERNCRQKQRVVDDKHLTSSESQRQFPVKDMLFQWLKHQFKQVNSLWSFALPKDIFIPKFCKKNQKMKMEMTLNGVDEETKQRLIDYINKFNLGFEEHCGLCTGNETVFEIDVTSILDDQYRLQSFLTFLKSIDSEKSKVSNRNVVSNLDIERTVERINIKHQKKKKLDYQSKSCRKSAALEKNTYQTFSLSATSTESSHSCIAKQKRCASKQDKKGTVSEGDVKIIHPQVKSKKVIQGKKRARQISTLAGTNDVQNDCDQPKDNLEYNNKFSDPRKVHFEQNVFSVQTNIANNKTSQPLTEVNRELSCKCLMHHHREDFYRYKHQCLFGKGDEINNSFIKYVNQRENKPESSLQFHENPVDSLPDEIVEDETFEILKVAVTGERPVSKITLHNHLKKNTPENLKTEKFNSTTDLNTNKGVSMKEDLNPLEQSNDDLKETFCLNECSPLTTTDDDKSVKVKDLELNATNACFKSLSYRLDSFPNMNTCHGMSMGGDAQGRNMFSFSNKGNSIRPLHEGRSNLLQSSSFEPTGQDKEMRTQQTCTVSCNCNVTFENEHHSMLKSPDLNVKILNSKSNSDNLEYKSKAVMKNERGSQECNCNENRAIDKGDVDDGEKLHDLMSNNFVSSGHKISSELLSNVPTNYNKDGKICPQKDENKCCIFGCDCEKSTERKPKIKTIVFRIGSSNKEFKICSIPSSSKRSCKLKSLKPKEVCKKISSVFKGNESVRNEECNVIWNNEKADNTVGYSSTRDKSFTNKSDTISNSWVNCEDYSSFIDSLTSRSKGTTLTKNSVSLESSSLIESSLGVLLSELKSQRMEIDYMKNLLGNQIT